MSMKVGMKFGRSNDYHQKKEIMVKRNNVFKKGKEILKQHHNMVNFCVDYLHTPKFNAPKCDEWNYFVKKFKELLFLNQELIF